jgi:hypothetical protein
MTEQKSLQQRLQNYRKFKNEIVEPVLEELWYLRVPAFTAVLSFIFFAVIDQTLEVYRVFALNPSSSIGHILLSFISIFILSLCIQQSGEALAHRRFKEPVLKKCLDPGDIKAYLKRERNKDNVNGKQIGNITQGFRTTWNGFFSVLCLICQDMKSQKSNLINEIEDETEDVSSGLSSSKKVWALLWLPRFFGFVPLFSLIFGLFRTLMAVGYGVSKSENMMTGFWYLIVVLVIITIFFVKKSFKFPLIGLLIVLIFASIKFLNHEISNEEQCITTLKIGCHLSHNIYLFFGILITVLLSWFQLFVITPGNEPRTEIKGKSIPNYFNFDDSTDLLFHRTVLLVLGCLFIFVPFYIFTIPQVINNESAILIITIIIIAHLSFQYTKSKPENNNDKNLLIWIIFLLISFAIILISEPSRAMNLAPNLGPIAVIALFLIMFITLSSVIFYVGYKTKFPFIKVLLMLALVFSFFDLNDNHRLRQMPESSTALLPLETEFENWLKSRDKDISDFASKNPKKSYPIYLVSAQGGGIYAAYHAASTLARLQDLCPAFAHHVFAISGVSGGSLGATVFSSLVKAMQSPSQPKYPQECPGNLIKELTSEDNNRGPLEKKHTNC